jgi:Domain of unknown function (DUF2703)
MLRIDLLLLDVSTCTRCRGAHRNLESALEVARDVLAAAGTEVEVDRIHVESAAQARELGLVSSPTIRVNGRDIALELRESSCGSEGCTDGEHTESSVELILDAILREVYGGSVVKRARHPEPYDQPENLEPFVAGKAAAPIPAAAGCCSPAEQSSCCEAEDKAECCATTTGTACQCR